MNIKRSFLLTGLCLMVLLGLPQYAAADKSSSQSIVGRWIGTLDVGVANMRLRFNIKQLAPQPVVTMDSIDQGVNDIPVSKLEFDGATLVLEVAAAGAEFTGDFVDIDTIKGLWSQGGREFPLALKREVGEAITGPNRPQHPTGPMPYQSTEVTFKNESAAIELAGTLTLPSAENKVPAVVLISGSGPQDRDQQFMGHKTFLVLADYLTRKGIAVLRYDDRGVAESGGDFASATSLDFSTDTIAAVEYLKTRPEIDPASIGLIGHSEGGLIAPMVAVKSDDIAFLVLLAAPGLAGLEISSAQFESMLAFNGASDSAIAAGSHIYRALNKTAASQSTDPRVYTRLYDELWSSLSPSVKKELAAFGGGELSEPRVKQLVSPWFQYFIAHDPAEWLSRVRQPVLAMSGSKDVQVDAEKNLKAISVALKSAGNNAVEAVLLDNMNHLFQESETGRMAEYAQIEQTISPIALSTISNWIMAHRIAR